MNVSNHWTPMFCDWPVKYVQSLDSSVLWLTCWMCPIIRFQCSVIDLLNVYNHWTPMFCDWPVAVIQRCTIVYYFLFTELICSRLVYIFYFTMYDKLLQYFFNDKIGANFFSLNDLFMIYRYMTFVFYMLIFFFILVMYTDVHIYFIC